MSTRIYKFGDTSDPRHIGEKAATLAKLGDRGLSIPAWFVVCAGREWAINTMSEEVLAAFREISPDRRPVAVRSSATAHEEQENHLDGQFESFLNVEADQIVERVEEVRASGLNLRVKDYRQHRGLEHELHPPAVLVQRMVQADWSGVAFAVDPVSGDPSVAVIAAVRGLGDALADGVRDPDTFRVDLSGRVVSVEHASAGVPSGLPEEFVRRVAEMVRLASELRGSPQDIEWAVEANRLYLLQSRAMSEHGLWTADAKSESAPAGTHTDRQIIWGSSDITGGCDALTRPLTFSIARAFYEDTYKIFARLVGVRINEIEKTTETFSNMLGLVNGRVCWDLHRWYQALAMLPGYVCARRMVEQMLGISAPTSAQIAGLMGNPPKRSLFMDAQRLMWSVMRLTRESRQLSRRMCDFRLRLLGAMEQSPQNLQNMGLPDLAAYYRGLQNQLLKQWDAPITNHFLANQLDRLLRRLCAGWIDSSSQSVYHDLLRSLEGLRWSEPLAALREMAETVQGNVDLVNLFQQGSSAEILAEVNAHPRLSDKYHRYIESFSDCCFEAMKLESTTIADDPTPMLRCVGYLAERMGADAQGERGSLSNQASHRAQMAACRRLMWHPLRRWIFAWVWRNAAHRLRDRENLRFDRLRVMGRVRLVFREIGCKLAAAASLQHHDDIFYLKQDEVLSFIEAHTPSADLKSLVAQRKKEYEEFARLSPPPDRMDISGMFNPLDISDRPRERLESDPRARRGVGCCPGKVRGIVRMVRDPRNVQLRPGQILVAERADVGWVMLFPAATGVLIERAGILSPEAAGLREFNVPGVMGVAGVCAWLRDGDEIELDGSTGVVRLVNRATNEM